MHYRTGIAVAAVLALGAGCKKNNGETPATTDGSGSGTGSGSAAMTASGSGAAMTGSGSGSAPATGSGSAAGSAAPTSALPAGMAPLGDAPQGMDAAKAKACDTGDAAACLAAALTIAPTGAWRADLTKEEGDRRAAAAIKWAERACELGNGEGCYVWWRYDDKNAATASQHGCELGYQPTCGIYGDSFTGDGHSEEDVRKGRDLMETACRAGVKPFDADEDSAGRLCDDLAYQWSETTGKIKKDKAKVAELKQLACEQGRKWDCKCKKDEDCTAGSKGKGSDDEDEWFCGTDGYCSLPSTD